MARAARRSKRSKGLSVNFKGVEGKLSAVPEGSYQAKVVTVTVEEGNAAEYLKWEFELEGDGVDGRKVYLITSLSPAALWNLRGLLEALGQEVPDDEMDLDLAEFEGLPIGLEITNETFEGKKRSQVSDYFSAEDDGGKKSKSRDDDDEDEDEEPKKLTRAQKRRAAKAKEAEEDDDEADEKPVRRSRRSSRDEDDDEEDEKPARRSRRSRASDDEDEDEDEAPRGRKSKSKKKSADISEDEVNDMSEDELDGVVEEHELDVDIQKFRTLTKKRNAVIDALSEAGVL